ncbi:hypothetical protein Tco_0167645 [Tanacetum coccineum]
MENLKGELSSVEAENAKLSDEVENLMKGYMEDEENHSIRLQSNLEGLSSSLEFIQSQSQEADARLECSSMAGHQPDSDGAHGGCKFKNHELAIELFDGTLELRNAKVSLDLAKETYDEVLQPVYDEDATKLITLGGFGRMLVWALLLLRKTCGLMGNEGLWSERFLD